MINNSWLHNLLILKVKEEADLCSCVDTDDSGSSAVVMVTSSQMSVTVAAVLSSWWHQVKWLWQWQQCCRRGDIKSNECDSGSSAVIEVTSSQMMVTVAAVLSSWWHQEEEDTASFFRCSMNTCKLTSSVRTEAPDSCNTTNNCKIYIVCLSGQRSWFL